MRIDSREDDDNINNQKPEQASAVEALPIVKRGDIQPGKKYNLWTFLPDELKIEILSHLKPQDLLTLAQVCKYFNNLIIDKKLQKKLLPGIDAPTNEVRRLYQVYSPWPHNRTPQPRELLCLAQPDSWLKGNYLLALIKEAWKRGLNLEKTIITTLQRSDRRVLATLFLEFALLLHKSKTDLSTKKFVDWAIPYLVDIITNTIPANLNVISHDTIFYLLI